MKMKPAGAHMGGSPGVQSMHSGGPVALPVDGISLPGLR